MKKILGLICALFICVSVFAGNTVKVIDGKQVFKTVFSEKGTAVLEIDWSKVKYDYSKTMQEVWGDKYDYFVKTCEENLLAGFNSVSKGLQLSKETGDAKYKMLVQLKNIDKYFNVMNIVPGHTVKIWATVIVLSQNGEKVMEIEVDSMKGNRDFSPDDCYPKAFRILGERVAKGK